MDKTIKLDGGVGLNNIIPFQIDRKDHYNKFIEWAKDKSRIKEFLNDSIVGNYAIVEIFRVGLPEIKEYTYFSKNKDDREIKENHKFGQYIYPFAKILLVNEMTEGDFVGIKAGDIYKLPDSVANFSYTQKYVTEVRNEENNYKFVEAGDIISSQMSGSSLMDKISFINDKFADELRPADLFTFKFFLSTEMFITKYNYEN